MKAIIEIEYRSVPREIISAFEKNIDHVSVTVRHNDGRTNHYIGASDIVILVKELLSSAVIDGIKHVVKITWEKYAHHLRKKKHQEEENQIKLTFEIKADNTITFILTGNDPKNIDTATENIFKYLSDRDQQNRDFNNPDFKANNDLKPKIRMRWNPETKNWQPINFAEISKRQEEMLRYLNRNVSS